MPVDAQIPLMGKPVNVMSPFDLAQGQNAIEAGQQKNALMGMEMQQHQQALQQRNALLNIMRNPDSTNPQTGEITSTGFNALNQVNPELSVALRQKQSLAKQEQANSIYNQARGALAKMQVDDKQAEAISDLKTGAYEAFKAMEPKIGRDAAKTYVEQQILPGLNEKLKASGKLSPNQADNIPSTFNPDTAEAELRALTSHAQFVKREAEAKKQEHSLFTDEEGHFFRPGASGAPLDVWYPPEGKFVPYGGTAPKGLTKAGTPTIEMAAAKAGAITGAQATAKTAATGGGSNSDNPGGVGAELLQDRDTGKKYSLNQRTGKAFELNDEGDWSPISANKVPANAVKPGSGGATAGARESVFTQRVVLSANEAAKDLENVIKLPLTASSGLFGGRKQGPGLLDATKEVLANKATSQDVQSYNVMATGFQRALASIEAAGLMPTGSLTHQMDAVIFKEGDTNLTKLQKLAQTRQIVEAGLEVIAQNPRVSEKEKDVVKKIITSMEKSVPFTQRDLMALSAAQVNKPTTTLKDILKTSGTPAEGPSGAPKAGDVLRGYRFKGGDPAKQDNWEKAD